MQSTTSFIIFSLAWLLSFATAMPVDSSNDTMAAPTNETITPSTNQTLWPAELSPNQTHIGFTGNVSSVPGAFDVNNLKVQQGFIPSQWLRTDTYHSFSFSIRDDTTIDPALKDGACKWDFSTFRDFKPFSDYQQCGVGHYYFKMLDVQSPGEPKFKCNIEIIHRVQIGSKVYDRKATFQPPGLDWKYNKLYEFNNLFQLPGVYPDGGPFQPFWTTSPAPSGEAGDAAVATPSDNIPQSS